MTNTSYTINCDLGEGMSIEAEIMPFIDLASVACGGHFGDSATIGETLRLISKFGKKAGAHPSYPDKENFGRKSLSIEPKILIRSIGEQISLFLKMAQEVNLTMDHIKFHGALYNDAAENPELASLLVKFLNDKFPQTPIFVPPHSEIEKSAIQAHLPIKYEVFADRAYQDNYKLVSRSELNSLFTSKNQVNSHLEYIINHQKILTNSGKFIPIQADTICFHGDNSGIMEFLPSIRNQFWK